MTYDMNFRLTVKSPSMSDLDNDKKRWETCAALSREYFTGRFRRMLREEKLTDDCGHLYYMKIPDQLIFTGNESLMARLDQLADDPNSTILPPFDFQMTTYKSRLAPTSELHNCDNKDMLLEIELNDKVDSSLEAGWAIVALQNWMIRRGYAELVKNFNFDRTENAALVPNIPGLAGELVLDSQQGHADFLYKIKQGFPSDFIGTPTKHITPDNMLKT